MTHFSTPAEWHAFGIGFALAFYAERFDDLVPLARAAAYAVGYREPPSGHLADLRGESAYFAVGIVCGSVAGRLG